MAEPPQPGTPLDPDTLHDAAATFGLLSATARLQIVWLLTAGERDVTTLATELGQTMAAVSQHLTKLKLAGVIRSRRDGRRQIYLVEDPHLIEMVQLAVHQHADQGRSTRRTGHTSTAERRQSEGA